jgi:hypothetical protein
MPFWAWIVESAQVGLKKEESFCRACWFLIINVRSKELRQAIQDNNFFPSFDRDPSTQLCCMRHDILHIGLWVLHESTCSPRVNLQSKSQPHNSFPSFDLRWMARVPPMLDLLYRVLLTGEKRRFHTTLGPPLERKNPPSRVIADSFPALAALPAPPLSYAGCNTSGVTVDATVYLQSLYSVSTVVATL